MSCDDCIAESELLQEHEILQGQFEQYRGRLKEKIATMQLALDTGKTEDTEEKIDGLRAAADMFCESFKLPFL